MYTIDTCYFDRDGIEQTMTVYDDAILDLRVKVDNPVLELEDNTSGSLEMTVYHTNQAYGSITDEDGTPLFLMSSTIRVFSKTPIINPETGEGVGYRREEIWEGRPLSDERDFYNTKTIRCEGAYAYLNDVDQPYKEYLGNNGSKLEIIDFIKGVLTEYNKKASRNRRFYVDGTYVNNVSIPKIFTYKGSVETVDNLPASSNTINDLYRIGESNVYYAWRYTPGTTSTLLGWVDVSDSVYRNLGYSRRTGGEKTKDTIDSIIETVGGHVKVVTINGNRCLYYTVADVPEDDFVYAGSIKGSAQNIQFGKNLIDLVKTHDGSEFFTVLLPVGAEISTTNPETIESMCTNVFTDAVERQDTRNKLQISDAGTDVFADPMIAPFDTTAVVSATNTYGPRRAVWVDMFDGNGYDYYLFTAMTFVIAQQGGQIDPSDNNYLLMYHLRDDSARKSIIQNLSTMKYVDQGAADYVEYGNVRSVAQKKLTQVVGIQSLIQKFEIPETGCYNLGFAVDTDKMWAVQNGNPDQYRDKVGDNANQDSHGNPIDWGSNPEQWSLAFPKLYRSPYPRAEYQQLNVRKVPDSEITWVGTLEDAHNEDGYTGDPASSPYAKYGGDDHDIFYNRDAGGTIGLTYGAYRHHYLDRYSPFNHTPVQDWGATGWKEHYGGPSPDWTFLSGYFGHHVGRVMVEPGKTYYLNTRVTSRGFPKVPDVYSPDGQYPDVPQDVDYFDLNGKPNSWEHNNILSYALIARRVMRLNQNEAPRWVNELVKYKFTDTSVVTDELVMEKIEVPEAIFPERKASWDEPNLDEKYHLELWFTVDNCYVNGCSNHTDTPRSDGNPTNGYRPSVYVEDSSVIGGDSSEGTDWHKCVTVAPLNPSQPVGYENFPREYLVNKELADRYGVIVKRVDYDKATTPKALMEYSDLVWSLNSNEPSLEVSAVDLRACGVENVDALRWMQHVDVVSKEHGVNMAIVMSKMSINLSDLSSNTYTLGYEANQGISSM